MNDISYTEKELKEGFIKAIGSISPELAESILYRILDALYDGDDNLVLALCSQAYREVSGEDFDL